MSGSNFRKTEHVISCNHIREYYHATKNTQEEVLKLAVNQYQPIHFIENGNVSITLIAANATGMPKEIMEPFWDDLYNSLRDQGINIRGIWTADMSNQGRSGVLNERSQGDDTSWFDHSRDILLMVNHFRDMMPRPIVGIGHSMGCAQLANLAIFHPRLFWTLIFMEPMIQSSPAAGPHPVLASTFRPDLWLSREVAEESFRKNRVFRTWDERILLKYLQYGLRELPTVLYPSANSSGPIKPGSVTLTTSKHQEAWSYVRPNFALSDEDKESLLSPDLNLDAEGQHLYHRAEAVKTLENLKYLRPGVLYVFGGQSPLSTPMYQAEKMYQTGVGVGGSGGMRAEKVKRVVFHDNGHFLPYEKVQDCAEVASKWLKIQMGQFRAEEEYYKAHPSRKSDAQMICSSEEWKALIKKSPWELRHNKEKL